MTSLLPTGRQINLQLGWPSPALFPATALLSGANEVLTDFSATSAALVYGPNRGHIPLRKAVARWLGSLYNHDPAAIAEDRVCIAAGASQTLSNILLRFTDPTYTRRVWMVEPTYFLACPVFEDCGYLGRMRGVPEDAEGIDLDYLRAALAETEIKVSTDAAFDVPKFKTAANGYKKIFKHVIYLVPTFSNPSGKTMSLEHRHNLVKLAIEYDALIISDDVYDPLIWPKEKGAAVGETSLRPPPRLVDVNRELDPDSDWGNTVSNGSFSKIIAPGVRVSWAESTPAFATFLANTGATTSGGNPGQLASTFVEKMISSGALQRHIQEQLIPTYKERYHAMVDAIEEHLEPLGVRITTGKPYTLATGDEGEGTVIAGGFFLLITLPDGSPSTQAIAKTGLEKYDLKVAHGKMFEVKGDEGSRKRAEVGYGRTLRLCWAFHTSEVITEGIIRLKDILVEHVKD
ncbi:hypothetical protein G7046_g3759 [Stylonectria norvegica]|nr:hypothetical protein G7046_g3759 [Stylonectria norvegica]